MDGMLATSFGALVGAVTVLALLSVVVTALSQATQAVLRLRGRNLERGLGRLVTTAISNARYEDEPRDPIGLVFVHGIGEQEPGNPIRKFLESMRSAYPRATARRIHGPPLGTPDRDGTHDIRALEITGVGRTVRVYEAYWADRLGFERVKGTLDPELFLRLPWFPRLNASAGSFGDRRYGPLLVNGWVFLLAPIGPLLDATIKGWRVVAPLFAVAVVIWRLPRRIASSMRRGAATGGTPAPSSGPTVVEEVRYFPDAVVGDIFNYVADAGDEPNKVTGVAEEIVDRFRQTMELCNEDGCAEIQVVAHSLGSLVAYHGLTKGLERESTGPSPSRITRFYTLGSPLEKIRFFWPKLVDVEAGDLAVRSGGRTVAVLDKERFRWENFRSSSDPISGILKKYSLASRNHNCPGAGGFLTSHRGYLRSPTFLTVLSRGLGIRPPAPVRGLRPPETPTFLDRVRAAVEFGLSIAFFVVILAIAVVGLVLPGVLLAMGIAFAMKDDAEPIERWVVPTVVIATTALLYLVAFTMGRRRARETHAEFWAT